MLHPIILINGVYASVILFNILARLYNCRCAQEWGPLLAVCTYIYGVTRATYRSRRWRLSLARTSGGDDAAENWNWSTNKINLTRIDPRTW